MLMLLSVGMFVYSAGNAMYTGSRAAHASPQARFRRIEFAACQIPARVSPAQRSLRRASWRCLEVRARSGGPSATRLAAAMLRSKIAFTAPTCAVILRFEPTPAPGSFQPFIAWGKNDKMFAADRAHPCKRDLPELAFHLPGAGYFAVDQIHLLPGGLRLQSTA